MARKTWAVKGGLRTIINMPEAESGEKGGFPGDLNMFVKKLK
ncbi:hypothetical protein [Acetobacter ascendens]|uniref:Uncharacterized protein n=1 Tax=Acetobacter ascendens TaxID=481146 RepID=A0A1Y0UZL8_9PROT|nr:hypothetical protein [Acetobacter ascendens]ARW11322.1 hypothetical protein S101447_02276 [Acetobacter ascendens]GCD75282.1 hypothetical protein NBRC3299_1574 [Acetobacter pasteurianus NBRC 3299]